MNAFTHVEFSEVGRERARVVAASFERILAELEKVCPGGREFSLVKTKLEEAYFFAMRSIATSPFAIAEERKDADST